MKFFDQRSDIVGGFCFRGRRRLRFREFGRFRPEQLPYILSLGFRDIGGKFFKSGGRSLDQHILKKIAGIELLPVAFDRSPGRDPVIFGSHKRAAGNNHSFHIVRTYGDGAAFKARVAFVIDGGAGFEGLFKRLSAEFGAFRSKFIGIIKRAAHRIVVCRIELARVFVHDHNGQAAFIGKAVEEFSTPGLSFSRTHYNFGVRTGLLARLEKPEIHQFS